MPFKKVPSFRTVLKPLKLKMLVLNEVICMYGTKSTKIKNGLDSTDNFKHPKNLNSSLISKHHRIPNG